MTRRAGNQWCGCSSSPMTMGAAGVAPELVRAERIGSRLLLAEFTHGLQHVHEAHKGVGEALVQGGGVVASTAGEVLIGTAAEIDEVTHLDPPPRGPFGKEAGIEQAFVADLAQLVLREMSRELH